MKILGISFFDFGRQYLIHDKCVSYPNIFFIVSAVQSENPLLSSLISIKKTMQSSPSPWIHPPPPSWTMLNKSTVRLYIIQVSSLLYTTFIFYKASKLKVLLNYDQIVMFLFHYLLFILFIIKCRCTLPLGSHSNICLSWACHLFDFLIVKSDLNVSIQFKIGILPFCVQFVTEFTWLSLRFTHGKSMAIIALQY